MPRPIPVYIVERPSFGGQLIVALLIFGFAVALLKLAIIAALGLGALYLAARIMIAAPGPFFSLAIWGGGLYLTRGSVALMIAWSVLCLIIGALIVARGSGTSEAVAPLKALPAPEA